MSTNSSRKAKAESSASTAQAFPFRIGIASVDITPPVGATMIGYRPRISDHVGCRLRAESLFCAGDDGCWLLICGDFIGLARSCTDMLRTRIATRTHVPEEAVLIAGTHTHSGPHTLGLEEQSATALDRAFFDEFLNKLVAVAERSVALASPGRFEVTATEAPQLLSNRRIKGPDGTLVNEWQDPEGRHPGYVDPSVLIATVRRPRGWPGQEPSHREAVIVNYGCHPVVLGPASMAISGDYPGYLKEALEDRDGGRTAMFLLAACGNINPRVCITESADAAKAMGTTLAEIIESGLAAGTHCRGEVGRVGAASEEWRIVRGCKAANSPEAPNNQRGDTVTTVITALAAGDVCFLGLPGEPFSEFSAAIRRDSPFRHTFIVALAQDYPGYFPTDAGQREGGYEARVAPAEALETPLIEHALRAMKNAATRPRARMKTSPKE